MKKILVTGAESYIGISLNNWLALYEKDYQLDELDMRDERWKSKDFSHYDVVFHVAGLAHADIGNVNELVKTQYYNVNCDLAIETAKKAKSDGIKHFIFMSSIIVYGSCGQIGEKKIINRDTIPCPTNFYGDSKLQAENGILQLKDKNFIVTILRPPMIYGKGSKGNYPLLAKLASKLPIFPDIENQRSMIYINNFCEFVKLVIDTRQEGILFPQNLEYGKTTDIVKMVAEAHGRKIWITPMFNWIFILAGKTRGKIGNMIGKAFGNLVYENNINQGLEFGSEYQIYSLKKSIQLTEKPSNSKIDNTL